MKQDWPCVDNFWSSTMGTGVHYIIFPHLYSFEISPNEKCVALYIYLFVFLQKLHGSVLLNKK